MNRKLNLPFVAVSTVALISSLLLFLSACGAGSAPKSAIRSVTQTQEINLDVATTVGNHTYIPLNMQDDEAEYHTQEILQVLDAFEKAHPDWEITSWHIEESHGGYARSADVYGIWIDHRPKAS